MSVFSTKVPEMQRQSSAKLPQNQDPSPQVNLNATRITIAEILVVALATWLSPTAVLPIAALKVCFAILKSRQK